MAGDLAPWLGADGGKRSWLAVRNSVLMGCALVGPFLDGGRGRAGVENQGNVAAADGPRRLGQAK